jgi:hypothetical protein
MTSEVVVSSISNQVFVKIHHLVSYVCMSLVFIKELVGVIGIFTSGAFFY